MMNFDEFLIEWESDCPFITAHTSGSTGRPKEIRLPKADMILSAKATNNFFGLSEYSRSALPLSIDYIAGKMMAVRAIVGGYRLDILPVSNNIVLPDNYTCYDLIPVVPAQLPSLLSITNPKRIANVLIGGASPDENICRRLTAKGFRSYISYGMTETCSHVALCSAADDERIYHAMPGIRFSGDGRGCLVIEAPEFSFRRLVTNDIVELDGDKSFRWRGRVDGAINSGGLKLLPEELERLYAPLLPGIRFYVTGRRHEKWGECICIVIEGTCDGEAAIDKLRCNLNHKLCPKCHENVPTLPLTANGKIRRI